MKRTLRPVTGLLLTMFAGCTRTTFVDLSVPEGSRICFLIAEDTEEIVLWRKPTMFGYSNADLNEMQFEILTEHHWADSDEYSGLYRWTESQTYAAIICDERRRWWRSESVEISRLNQKDGQLTARVGDPERRLGERELDHLQIWLSRSHISAAQSTREAFRGDWGRDRHEELEVGKFITDISALWDKSHEPDVVLRYVARCLDRFEEWLVCAETTGPVFELVDQTFRLFAVQNEDPEVTWQQLKDLKRTLLTLRDALLK